MAEVKLKSMKRSAADKRSDAGEVAPITSIAPDYPYGLTIHMDKDELDKIGLKTLPKIGTEMIMCVKVKVTCVRQSPVAGRDEETSVDFQITDVGIETDEGE